MKALAIVDLFTLLKESSKKQLTMYEKVLTDLYHIVEMIDLNDAEQKKIKELNNVFDLVPKRPGDTQERLNKLSLIESRKEQLQYTMRSKNVFGDISEKAKKLGIYKGDFIESQRIKVSQENKSNVRIIESILEDNEKKYNKQNARMKILKFINRNKI